MYKNKILIILLTILFGGCDVKYDILLPNLEEGTVVGYDLNECFQMQSFCLEEEGDWFYTANPDEVIMCSCKWPGTEWEQE